VGGKCSTHVRVGNTHTKLSVITQPKVQLENCFGCSIILKVVLKKYFWSFELELSVSGQDHWRFCVRGHEHQGVLSYLLRDRTDPEAPVGLTQSHTRTLQYTCYVTVQTQRPQWVSRSHTHVPFSILVT